MVNPDGMETVPTAWVVIIVVQTMPSTLESRLAAKDSTILKSDRNLNSVKGAVFCFK